MHGDGRHLRSHLLLLLTAVIWGTAFVFQEMAIAAGPTGQDPSGGRPCGACLQVMQEFAPDLRIWIVDEKAVAERRLSDLLPDPFVPGGQLPGGADGNDAGGHEE